MSIQKNHQYACMWPVRTCQGANARQKRLGTTALEGSRLMQKGGYLKEHTGKTYKTYPKPLFKQGRSVESSNRQKGNMRTNRYVGLQIVPKSKIRKHTFACIVNGFIFVSMTDP